MDVNEEIPALQHRGFIISDLNKPLDFERIIEKALDDEYKQNREKYELFVYVEACYEHIINLSITTSKQINKPQRCKLL